MAGKPGNNLGSRHGMSRLDESDVKMIKALLAERDAHRRKALELTCERIGEKFGVSGEMVRNISEGRNWSHV